MTTYTETRTSEQIRRDDQIIIDRAIRRAQAEQAPVDAARIASYWRPAPTR